MADWAFVPTKRVEIEEVGPKTLVKEFEDGSTSRRRKSSATKRRWSERYNFSSADCATAKAFFRTKGTDVTFSKVTYDPEEAADTEADVTFSSKTFKAKNVAPGEWEVSLRFVEAL